MDVGDRRISYIPFCRCTSNCKKIMCQYGKKLGGKIKDVMTIVSYSTFRRWVRKMEDSTPVPAQKSAKKGAGRPKLEEDVRDTIIRIRKETGFGYTKILQELRRMGVHVSRQTVKNVIMEAGFAPTPGDHPDTWHKFLKRYAATLWQCDFACEKKWTIKGLVDVYFMVFIDIRTRQIWISPCTENPTGEWTTQQGRNFQTHASDNDLKCEILMRDRDRKFVDSFDDVFRSSDCQIKLTPIRSTNLQAHVERVIQTIKHEVLNAFCIVTNEHLNSILSTTQSWYSERTGYSSRDHLPPIRDDSVTLPVRFSKDRVVCDSELGGHLISYRHVA